MDDDRQTQLRSFLRGYQQCRLWLGSATALCCAGCAAVGCLLLAAVVLEPSASGVWRWALLGAAPLVAVAGLVILVVLPWRRLGPAAARAREVERALGEDRLELVSAIQLGRLPLPGGVSAELAAAHTERVLGRLAGLSPAALVDRRPLRRALLALVLSVLVLAGAGTLWPEALRSGWSGLFAPARAAAAVRDLPSWVGDIRLTYRYPAYAARADRTVPGSDGTVLALPGTQVRLQARSDRPIRTGRLLLDDGEVALQIEDRRELSASLVVNRAGSWRFELEDEAGERWTSPRPYPVLLEVDRAPTVGWTESGADRVVRETDTLDLRYDARDDYGLTETRLVWRRVGRGEEQRRVLRRFSDGERRASRQEVRWELAPLGLAPGDQIQVLIEAADNDTILGPKVGRSPAITLTIYSAEAHHRELMARVRQWWDRLLLRLADHLDDEPPVRAGDESLERHRALQRGLQELLAETPKLLDDLVADPRAWSPLVEALALVRRRLDDMQREAGWHLELAERARPGAAAGLRPLADHRARRVERLERDALYLEDLLDRERLDAIERLSHDLADAQRRLADLLARYRQAPSEEARRQLETEIAQLKERIAELLRRQAEALGEVRDEYLNPEALSRLMSQRDMLGSLDRLQALLMEGKLDEAAAEIDKLGRQLQELQQAVERARESFGQQRYGELARALQQLQGELTQVVESQRRLTEETGELRRRLEERLRQGAQREWSKKLADWRRRLEQLVEQVEGIEAGELDSFSRSDREQVLEQARGLGKLLGAGDLAGAVEESGALAIDSSRLAEALRGLAAYERRLNAQRAERLGRSAARARRASELAEGLHRELSALLPEAARLLKPAEKNRLGALQRQQQELRERLGQVRDEMARLDRQAPIFGPQALGALDRGGRHQQRAAGRLGNHDPRAAHPEQQAALSELERVQQQMQQQCQQGGAGQGMPLPLGGGIAWGRDGGGPGRPDQERVEIPGPEEHESPEAFRKELLDGMKDPVPDDYRPQVRRYYEELVR